MNATIRIPCLLIVFGLLAGCGRQETPPPGRPTGPGVVPTPGQKASLTEARRGFQTKLVRQTTGTEPPPKPPADLFRLVRYESPAGKLAAYLSKAPADGKKHPAILWLFGGFSNGIGATAWARAPAANDQSARAFREAGIVMMYPSLRGGNDNPGFREGFFGEVDDVLAAADYLAKQDFVDPKRIYLGGHSTGGTLALLVAASTDRFRGVFSFGPADDVAGYGEKVLPFDTRDPKELELRAPGRWLHAIGCPTYVFEGTDQGNMESLEAIREASRNPRVKTYPVKGANHFSLLAPVTKLVAGKILRDEGPTTNLTFTEAELGK